MNEKPIHFCGSCPQGKFMARSQKGSFIKCEYSGQIYMDKQFCVFDEKFAPKRS